MGWIGLLILADEMKSLFRWTLKQSLKVNYRIEMTITVSITNRYGVSFVQAFGKGS